MTPLAPAPGILALIFLTSPAAVPIPACWETDLAKLIRDLAEAAHEEQIGLAILIDEAQISPTMN